MMKKNGIVSFLALVMLLNLAVPNFAAGADVPDEQFNKYVAANSNQVAAYWSESTDLVPPLSGLVGTNPIVDSVIKSKICDSIFDSECSNFNRFFWASYSGFCDDSKISSPLSYENNSSLNCLEAIFVKDTSGKVVSVDASKIDLIRSANPQIKSDYKGTDLLMPSGSNRSIVQIPGVSHKGGSDLYLVDMFMSGDLYRVNNGEGKCFTQSSRTSCFKEGEENKFFASIRPIVATPATFAPYDQESLIDKSRIFQGFGSGTIECVLIEKNTCWKAIGFPEGYSFGLKLKLSIGQLNGWMHGRAFIEDFQSTSAEVLRGKAKLNTQEITILGSPSKVAIAGGLKDDSSLGEMMKSLNISTIRNFFYNSFWSSFSLDRFIGFSPLIGDKALASPQVWSIRSFRLKDLNNLESNSKNCLKAEPGVTGYVSTNATAYNAGPPAFNNAERSLDYKVASTHLNSDGTLNKGNYSLVLKTNVANCIYGFNSAPISATISVLSNNGENIVASSTLQSSSEWIKLRTENFTFSAPTLRVKMESSKKAPLPTTVAEKPIASARKTTITCVKGKQTKKVTAVSPKCPVGYKKK